MRYEFDGFQPIAIAGGAAAHAAIQRNLLYALTGGLRGKPCQPYGSDLKIKAAAVVFSRKSDDWVTDLLTGDEAILRMPEIGLDIPPSEIYAGVAFEAGETAA